LAQINGAVNASASIIVQNGQTDRYDAGAPVMIVSPDGKTIVAGADGSLTISTITAGTHTLTVSSVITVASLGYVAPWHPGAVQETGRDNIFTDLVGSVKIKSTSSAVDVTEAKLAFVNDHVDLENYYGSDANKGFVAGNRLTMTLTITADLSNENIADIIQSANFVGYDPVIVLGSGSGRRQEITAPKWIPSFPNIEVPENGTTPITLEGVLYQSQPGMKDSVVVAFK
jgi:hypothetical protein